MCCASLQKLDVSSGFAASHSDAGGNRVVEGRVNGMSWRKVGEEEAPLRGISAKILNSLALPSALLSYKRSRGTIT